MYLKLKRLILHILNVTGISYLIAQKNSHKIRILCYHGVSSLDEHEFMPSNFMRFETFKKRILFLQKSGYNFITLQDAIKKLETKKLSKKDVVITIDDGFDYTFKNLIPWVLEKKLPITNYVTTYYSVKDGPIFRIICQYIMWKSNKHKLDITSIKNEYDFPCDFIQKEDSSLWDFIGYAEKNLSHEQRNSIYPKLAKLAQVEISEDIISSFSIASNSTLKEFAQKGLDIQLHTHRHYLPDTDELLKKEISENQEHLNDVANNQLVHFCYPSGIYSEKDLARLKKYNMISATTCDPGLVSESSNPLALERIIDSEAMDLTQFKAEIEGVGDLFRKLK